MIGGFNDFLNPESLDDTFEDILSLESLFLSLDTLERALFNGYWFSKYCSDLSTTPLSFIV